MRPKIRPIVILPLASAFLAVLGAGGRAAHGFGEEMQNVGDSIQTGTE